MRETNIPEQFTRDLDKLKRVNDLLHAV